MSDGDGYIAAQPSDKINCYSDRENGFMEWSQSIRARWLKPLLAGMAGLGLRGNHITLLSMLSGLAFCPLFIWNFQRIAFGALLLHVLLDGLDGPLARYRGQASNRGSFTDTMADQIVVTLSTLTAMHAGLASAWSGGLYVFLYALVVAFAFARNAMSAPYSWLFRPRFFVFFWLVAEVYWFPNTLSLVLWSASAILALKCLTGFVKIRNRM